MGWSGKKLFDYFSDANFNGSICEKIVIYQNGTIKYCGTIMYMLKDKRKAGLILIDEPEFQNGVGYIACVK